MKRVPDELDLTLPPVHLHLDDLEYILQRLSDGMEPSILYKGFVYDSLDEFVAHIKRDTISEIDISGRRRQPTYGYIKVRVKPDSVWVRADHVLIERGAALAEFLRSRVPWYSWRPSGSWWHGLQGALGMILMATAPVAVIVLTPLPLASRVVLASVVWVLCAAFTFPSRVWIGGSRIRLYPSVSHVGFWERHREKLLVSLISSILSGLVGFLIGRISR